MLRKEKSVSALRLWTSASIATVFIVIMPAVTAVASAARPNGHGPSVVRIPTTDKSDIPFEHISMAQGLSQSRVTAIVQDDQGFIWFATQYGLNRYDGYRFRVYTHDPARPDSLCGEFIYSLFKDRSGSIWVGCDHSLDRYEPTTDSFVHYPIDPHANGMMFEVRQISQDDAGMLWLATQSGLYRLDPRTGLTQRFHSRNGDPFSLDSDNVKFSGEDHEGRFWVATGKGLEEFDRKTGLVLLHVPIDEPLDLSFYEDRDGVFWILCASGNGLAVLDRTTHHLTLYSFSSRDLPHHPLTGVSSMLEDRAGNLWVGTFSDGLLRYDRASKRFIRYANDPTQTDSLGENRITTLYQDREGDIWVGLGATAPSFFRTTITGFKSLHFDATNSANLGEHLVNTIFQDHAGNLWLGTTGALERMDQTSGRYTHLALPGEGIASDVLSIAEDRNGMLWIGTSGQGLVRLDRRTHRFRVFRHRPGDRSSLSNDIVPALLVDHKGALWAATGNGLDEFDGPGKGFRTYIHGDSSGGTAVYTAVAEDAQGVLWVGTQSTGVLRFDPRKLRVKAFTRHQFGRTPLSDDRVNRVAVLRSGAILIATQNGFDRLDSRHGSLTNYSVRDGLASNAVSCLLEDNSGDVWMGTTAGLSRFDPQSGEFENYDVADGLPGTDLTGWSACFRSETGELFFGGFSGAVAVDPSKVRDSTYVPPIVLTSFSLFGVPVRPRAGSLLPTAIGFTHDLKLNHDQNSFSFEFSALSFASPETNRYRYRLRSLNDHWTTTTSDQRVASYTNLNSGRYYFDVQGATIRGPWSPSLTVGIDILPAWWQTRWFRAVAILMTALILALLYFSRIRSLARRFEIRFQERMQERTRIARELHDSLLQGFQGVIFRLQAIRNVLPAQPEAALAALEQVLGRGDAAIAEARTAVQDLRATGQSENDLVEALEALRKEFGSRKDGFPSYRLVVEGKQRTLPALVRDEIYCIAREALRNAYYHSGAGRIELEVAFSPAKLTVRIRDDGIGLDSDVLTRGAKEGHFGLTGMRERTARLRGTLHLWSERGAGTEVELSVPGNIAYGRDRGRNVPMGNE